MGLIRRNIQFGPALKLSGWRKIAIGTWRRPGDPSVYGVLEVEIEPALQYLEKVRQKTGKKVTLTHFIGKAIATVLARHPDLNCMLRWGRLYPRKDVDIFFQVASDTAGKDLSGVTIRQADKKSIAELADEMAGRVAKIREKGDPEFKQVKGMMRMMPGMLVGKLLDLTSILMYTFNIWSPLIGSPRDPFGSAMITSIGSLGLDAAFAPLVPYSRIPLLVAIGVAKDTPVAREGGRVEVARMVRLCATIDHRLIDGVHAANMNKTLTAILADPEKEWGVV